MAIGEFSHIIRIWIFCNGLFVVSSPHPRSLPFPLLQPPISQVCRTLNFSIPLTSMNLTCRKWKDSSLTPWRLITSLTAPRLQQLHRLPRQSPLLLLRLLPLLRPLPLLPWLPKNHVGRFQFYPLRLLLRRLLRPLVLPPRLPRNARWRQKSFRRIRELYYVKT